MQHSSILLTFLKLPSVIKIFVLYIFEWQFYIGFTVLRSKIINMEGTFRALTVDGNENYRFFTAEFPLNMPECV